MKLKVLQGGSETNNSLKIFEGEVMEIYFITTTPYLLNDVEITHANYPGTFAYTVKKPCLLEIRNNLIYASGSEHFGEVRGFAATLPNGKKKVFRSNHWDVFTFSMRESNKRVPGKTGKLG
jgi:hypothetical protein